MNTGDSWHLSKTVPLSLIFAIACQTATLIWFVAQLSGDLNEAKKDIIRLETRTDSLEKVVQDQAVTMARMDENIKAIRDAVEKLADVRKN
ncbi:MAG: hypothetical protein ABEI13_02345 [Candidatus Paceibacteria bacterium]